MPNHLLVVSLLFNPSLYRLQPPRPPPPPTPMLPWSWLVNCAVPPTFVRPASSSSEEGGFLFPPAQSLSWPFSSPCAVPAHAAGTPPMLPLVWPAVSRDSPKRKSSDCCCMSRIVAACPACLSCSLACVAASVAYSSLKAACSCSRTRTVWIKVWTMLDRRSLETLRASSTRRRSSSSLLLLPSAGALRPLGAALLPPSASAQSF